MTRQTGKEAVHKLVNDFEKNESQYMSKNFQEAEARKLFIDPFFTALGWEFYQTGIAKKFWDVHLEVKQRDNSVTKKPDYAFRVKEGAKYREKFFVEAKAPHVDLQGPAPVFQAKRYAFSSHGKIPIVILTDFQTFRVFNGLEKPVFENPLQGLIKGLDLEYHTYLDTWDAIWDTFSKEAVTEGSIEQLIGKVGRNAKSLDDEFLADISGWRETLARNVAIRNKDLSVDHINEAVQRILDRLIFIRNLEDREIESENGLLAMLDVKENIYPHLLPLFKNLDGEYNGLLFKEHFSEKVVVDDPTIKGIIKQLYPPNSPYAFDMIEPEILGRIYERFLGSKIRLTENHQAKVEEKPEVRHAGGVYYTPQYIVDYIVENTVGVRIKDKTPEEIAEIKICDPACGSGSFLLGAFQYLIEYHREWYAKASQTEQKKYKDDFFTNAESEIQLTLKKKTEILKNNLFGVDIDREATEVAIMSLYLKILDEGYDKGQIELFMRGHILPDMAGNIKCGNSLIGTDFYNQGNLALGNDNLNKVNCFDWEKEFNHLIDKEYLTTNHTNQHEQENAANNTWGGGGIFDIVIGNPPYVQLNILEENSRQYLINKYTAAIDLYSLFIEKSLALLKKNNVLGFIVPSLFIKGVVYQILRDLINKKCNDVKIKEYGDGVFKGVKMPTCVVFFTKSEKEEDKNYFENKSKFIFQKVKTLLLNDVASITRGLEIGKDKLLSKGKHICLTGKNIDRYLIKDRLYIDAHTFKDFSKDTEIFASPKIMVRETGNKFFAVIDYDNVLTTRSIYNTKIINRNYTAEFLLGILSSKLFEFYFRQFISPETKIFPKIRIIQLRDIPIPVLDLSQKSDKTKHDNLVSLVDKMLDLKKREAAEMSDHQKTVITRQIDAVDKAIDTAVYELYNLTADEIKVVEGKAPTLQKATI